MARNQKKWTQKEVEFLKTNLNKLSAREMGDHLGRSRGCVRSKMKMMGFELDPEFKEELINKTFVVNVKSKHIVFCISTII